MSLRQALSKSPLNPADSTLVERTLERHIDLLGKAPRQVAMDGGFASKDNVAMAKTLGVEDMTLKRALQMSRCSWRGAESFKAYVWASITSFNLIAMARHLLAREFA